MTAVQPLDAFDANEGEILNFGDNDYILTSVEVLLWGFMATCILFGLFNNLFQSSSFILSFFCVILALLLFYFLILSN